MSTIKNIVFDLGGVLIDWNPRYVYRNIFKTEDEIDRFLKDICTMDWNVQQDAGRSLAQATSVLQAEFPEWSDEIAAYYGRWEEMLGGPINESVRVLEQLIASKKYRVLALTNWSAETFPVAQARYDFLQWFEGIVVSGVEGCIKPDPEIYQILFERYALNPEESLFIDDNIDNVKGSEAMNMSALHFEGAQKLRTDLLSHGIDLSTSKL